jgi:hypothetical protein
VTTKTTDEFWSLFRALPPDVRRQALEAYQQFQRDPFHPSLHVKELDKKQHIWSARISRGYRVLGRRAGNEIVWT